MKHIFTTIAAVVMVGCGPNIHEATWSGNIEAVKHLIAADFDVNAKRNRGETPLHIAALVGNNEIVELF